MVRAQSVRWERRRNYREAFMHARSDVSKIDPAAFKAVSALQVYVDQSGSTPQVEGVKAAA
jgi:hypothetical protein